MASQGMKAPSMLALALHSTVAPLALTIMNATGKLRLPTSLMVGSMGHLGARCACSPWLRASLVRLLVACGWLWFPGGLAVWAGLFVLFVFLLVGCCSNNASPFAILLACGMRKDRVFHTHFFFPHELVLYFASYDIYLFGSDGSSFVRGCVVLCVRLLVFCVGACFVLGFGSGALCFVVRVLLACSSFPSLGSLSLLVFCVLLARFCLSFPVVVFAFRRSPDPSPIRCHWTNVCAAMALPLYFVLRMSCLY